MEIADCFYFGIITKAHGLKGEVDVFMDVDDPSSYMKLDAIFLQFGNDLVPYFVERIIPGAKGHFRVKFEDVDRIEDAEQLAKVPLYLPAKLLPELKGNQFYYHEIAGFSVEDRVHGPIGKVVRVIEFPGNPLIEIDFNRKDILLPIKDDVIQKVDRPNKKLFVDAPEGLIELYLDDNPAIQDED